MKKQSLILIKPLLRLKKPKLLLKKLNIQLKDPRWGYRSQEGASGVKMWLQKQRCSCRSIQGAAGANKELQEPIFYYWSQDVTAGAMMWLQEQDVALVKKMWLQEKIV